uniref:MFS domain-containing protein n=1 Tax=Brugia timori TaxID=42155 RepID=A0A0R3R4L7_9BILA
LGSARLNLALVGFVGFFVVFMSRTDVSFAIVCMVNSTAVEMITGTNDANVTKKSATCAPRDDSELSEREAYMGEFIWTKDVQGYVLSAFFWGYISSQILGGYLASRYGGRLVIGITVLGCAVLTLLSPIAATTSVFAFIIARAIIGFMQGAIFPAYHAMWSMWAPPLERSLLTGVTYAGMAGVLWCVLWFSYVSDRPSQSKRISKKELSYIENSLADILASDSKKKRAVPWLAIFKSVPVWAVFCGHFAGDWGGHMMITTLPLFMNDVLGLDFASLGFLTAIPYITYFVCMNFGGFTADKLQKANVLSTIAIRPLGSQAVFLIASGYCGCGQETLVTIFLTVGIGLSGIQYSGYMVSYLDIAPAFAGPILGIGNTIPCIAGIIGPVMVGYLTPTGSQQEWQLVFWITGGVLLAGTTIFCLFAK